MIPCTHRVSLLALPHQDNRGDFYDFIAAKAKCSPALVEGWAFWLEEKKALPVTIWDGLGQLEAQDIDHHIRALGGRSLVSLSDYPYRSRRDFSPHSGKLFASLQGIFLVMGPRATP